MTGERRYDEQEVARIFEAAASPAAAARGAAQARGLTLPELQSIGREVGLPAERVAAAALALDEAGAAAPRQSELGMPVGVGRVVELPRPLTDREWSLLVGELREVFGARGREGREGEVRSWTNSNLHAYVEPTLDGWRLRMGTRKGDARTVNAFGVIGMVAGAAAVVGMVLAGEPVEAGTLVLSVFGGGLFGLNAVRLSRWANERERQFAHIAERVRVILSREPAPDARVLAEPHGETPAS